jgi:dihydrofolate reductase
MNRDARPISSSALEFPDLCFRVEDGLRANPYRDPRAKPTRADAVFVQDNTLWMSHTTSIRSTINQPQKQKEKSMRNIITTMWVTLDGFVAGPNEEMDWVGESYDEAMGKYEYDLVSAADTLLLGRVTYESFAGAWPKVPDNPQASKGEVEYAHKLNAMHKIVFSKTLDKVEWNNSRLEREIVPEEISKLKQEPGRDLVIYGSLSVVRALTRLGLIDEYQLLVHPVVLGEGKPLWSGIQDKVKLELVQTKTHPSGVVILYYRPKK